MCASAQNALAASPILRDQHREAPMNWNTIQSAWKDYEKSVKEE